MEVSTFPMNCFYAWFIKYTYKASVIFIAVFQKCVFCFVFVQFFFVLYVLSLLCLQKLTEIIY